MTCYHRRQTEIAKIVRAPISNILSAQALLKMHAVNVIFRA